MRFVVPVLLLAALAGCASVPLPTEDERQARWQARQALLAGLKTWEITGRIALRIENEGWHANLRWQQSGETFLISIYDPLGRTVARLSGTPGEATLHTRSGEVFQAADAERMMFEQLGWSLPVRGMSHWVLGLPAPGSEAKSLDINAKGKLSRLSQSGWDIQYTQYASFKSANMPERLRLEHDPVRIKLVIDEWDLRTP